MRTPEFWTSHSAAAKAVSAALAPLGALYGLSVRAASSRARPYRSPTRVLCVGNLTAGGAGKTPVAIALGQMLSARGRKIVFLSRGYHGRAHGPLAVDTRRHSAADVGDEALLLAARAKTVVSRDRAKGAKLAETLGADIIVMDDGFQNFQLEKDLSIVVIDATSGFGNGRLIPAGPLRELPCDGLKRADAVVLMGDGTPDIPPFKGPVFRAQLVPTAPESVAGHTVLAFAGIGRPEKFFRTLHQIGARVITTQSFADHHRYTAPELLALKSAAKTAGALLVTTEKDFVRIDASNRAGILPLPVHAAVDGDAELNGMLDSLAAARA